MFLLVERGEELSGVSFIRALIPFLRTPLAPLCVQSDFCLWKNFSQRIS